MNGFGFEAYLYGTAKECGDFPKMFPFTNAGHLKRNVYYLWKTNTNYFWTPKQLTDWQPPVLWPRRTQLESQQSYSRNSQLNQIQILTLINGFIKVGVSRYFRENKINLDFPNVGVWREKMESKCNRCNRVWIDPREYRWGGRKINGRTAI